MKYSFGFDAKWIFILENGGLDHSLSHNGQKRPKMGKKVGFGQIGQSNLPRDKNSIWQWFLAWKYLNFIILSEKTCPFDFWTEIWHIEIWPYFNRPNFTLKIKMASFFLKCNKIQVFSFQKSLSDWIFVLGQIFLATLKNLIPRPIYDFSHHKRNKPKRICPKTKIQSDNDF